MHFKPGELRDGRKRLAKLLPGLRKSISLSDTSEHMQAKSVFGQAITDRIKEDSFEALVIRQTDRGWFADLILKGMPTGISNVMGTPEAHPLPSREDAEQAGNAMLRGLMRLAMENEIASRDKPIQDVRHFEVHNVILAFPGEMIDELRRYVEAMEPINVEDVVAQLQGTIIKHVGADRLDDDTWQKLTDPAHRDIFKSVVVLLAMDQFRYPLAPSLTSDPDEDEYPSGPGH